MSDPKVSPDAPGASPEHERRSFLELSFGSAAASLFAAERVYNHRHHVTDVVAGGLLGATQAALIFYYQEHRYRSRHAPAVRITPIVTGDSALLELVGTF